jgi:hypothetical protein
VAGFSKILAEPDAAGVAGVFCGTSSSAARTLPSRPLGYFFTPFPCMLLASLKPVLNFPVKKLLARLY